MPSADGVDPSRINIANFSATKATESSHHTFIGGTGQIQTQASFGRKTKRRRKRKLTVEADRVEMALAVLPLTHGKRSM